MAEVTVRGIGLLTFINPGETRRILVRQLNPGFVRWFTLAPLTGLHRSASFTMAESYSTTQDDDARAIVAVTNNGPDQSGSVEVIMLRTAV